MRLIEEILADINKAKAKVTSVELEIGHTTGVTSQINRLIQAQNLLTYCHSRLSDIDPESLRPKWISVKDRLPEIPEGWAECPSPVLYMMKSTKTIYAGYYGENGIYRDKYFRQYADAYEGVDAIDVLCWMWQCDLPEPPDTEDCP